MSTAFDEILPQLKPGVKVLHVPADLYAKILTELEVKECYRYPQPPVKRREVSGSSGFFHASYSEVVEYDHHAPRYLKALADWERRQLDKKSVVFAGPYGDVEILLAKEDK